MTCSRFALPIVAFSVGLALLLGCTGGSSGRAASAPPTASSAGASAVIVDAHPAFPTADAHTALSAAGPVLRSCRRNTHATPVVFEATLEFDPSGKVSKAAVAPGGPVSDCVRSELTQIEIPKFEGAPVEVQMQVTL